MWYKVIAKRRRRQALGSCVWVSMEGSMRVLFFNSSTHTEGRYVPAYSRASTSTPTLDLRLNSGWNGSHLPYLPPSHRGPQVLLPKRLLKMPQVSAETTPFNSTVTDILVNLILISSSLLIIYPSSLTFQPATTCNAVQYEEARHRPGAMNVFLQR